MYSLEIRLDLIALESAEDFEVAPDVAKMHPNSN